MPYRTIDLCSGIGGIRRGFELAGDFRNLLSAEIDKYACSTYEHLFGENPQNDITSEAFKVSLESVEYDVLLAGFPCQTFSRAGLQEGFYNETKGIIFGHIADIIRRTHPKALFLENVDHLVTHNRGETFKQIIETLDCDLNYKIIGVSRGADNALIYNTREFIRNSRRFGVPQNRPRTYIVGFDRAFYGELVELLPQLLPQQRDEILYNNLNEVLERNIDPKYYMSSGYLNTLVKHEERQRRNGNGFGYRIVNTPEIENPVSNTLLATGGSGKERNLVIDVRPEIPGMTIIGKRTQLNDQCVRFMTPTEWGKLQGFINYAFIDENGIDRFEFPQKITNAQKYKQFGNSVTIPVIKSMAEFMLECFRILED